MSSVTYEGKKVNNSIHDLKALSGRFPGVASRVQGLTSAMVSCRGFNHIGSGVTSTSFSSEINNSASELDGFVSKVRNMQVKILSYSNEENDIQEFLDDLDRKEYKDLDLSGIESHIGVGRKLTNGFKSLAATLFTAGAGVVEGVCDFVETGADLIELGKSAVGTIFTGTYDLFTGSDTTKQMWEATKAKVSEKKVENAFNNFYNNTEFGRSIKNNAYGFDAVRGISSGLGYTAGIIGLNMVTGGLASGLGIGSAGSVGVGQLAATAGLMGFSSGTEDAWADGASIGKGLLYGAATGAWEGTQWAIGAKINQYGGVGDRIASGIFKGGKSGAVTRVVLDTVDSGLEGFVQPGLKMIYKDYEGNSFADKYKNAFKEAGGWSNVRNQAIMGGIMSAGSEFVDARKILKSASDGKVQGDTATPKAAGSSSSEYRYDMAASEDIFEREMMEFEMAQAGDFSRNNRSTIDGDYIRIEDTEFNSSMATYTGVPAGSRKFLDGSYVPSGQGAGVLRSSERYYDSNSFATLLENRRNTLSGYDYTRFKDASEIFASHGKKFNLNELKLIANHSEGNLTRIKSALTMSDPSLRGTELDSMANELAKSLFPRGANSGFNIEKGITRQFIDELQRTGRDTWKSGSVIFDDLYTYDRALKNAQSLTFDTKVKRLNDVFGEKLSDDLTRKIANSDGFPGTISKLLATDANIPEYQRKALSEVVASKVFRETNAARVKAQYEIIKGNYDNARNLVASTNSNSFEINAELFKASEVFSQRAKRHVYYSLVDSAVDMGISKNDALKQVKLIYSYAMDQIGTPAAKASAENLFKSNTEIFGFKPVVFENFGSTRLPKNDVTPNMRRFTGSDGNVSARMIYDSFERMMTGKYNTGATPSGVIFFDYTKSVEANKFFKNSYADVVMNRKGDFNESLKVMSKLIDLENSGKKIVVYNNGGYTCSHRNGLTINLGNSTIDGRNAATVFHETGHYLFGNALGEQVPAGFNGARLRAEANMNSAVNADLLKAYKGNILELKAFSEYKGVQKLKSNLSARGYSSIDAYKKHLVDVYSMGSAAQNSDRLLQSTVSQGTMTRGAYAKDISSKFDFDNALTCANMDFMSTRAKVIDAISRTTAPSYTDTSGMIDSLTMSRENIWYGHTRTYFEGSSDPNLKSYHELIADYTSLRVQGNYRAIGFLRQLFGNELMDMLEKTYQDMLK